jgi:hypothetical protein
MWVVEPETAHRLQYDLPPKKLPCFATLPANKAGRVDYIRIARFGELGEHREL